jgi:Holliday junction resolvasome RuvABC endonuclease subunit
MNQPKLDRIRIAAFAPSARGFGYCIMEDASILECGYRNARGDKNLNSISKIEKLAKLFRPNIFVLHDTNAKNSRRAPRIKVLHLLIEKIAAEQKCEVKHISGTKLRKTLVGDANATKHQMAEILAKEFPVELGGKLPPKRRAWDSEDGRMDIFDATGLAVIFQWSQI